VTTRSLKIRKKHLIFSTLVSLATIQLINLGSIPQLDGL